MTLRSAADTRSATGQQTKREARAELHPCGEVEQRISIASPDRDWLLCRRLVKRKRALLGSNPPRNSRLETHSDGTGADRNWPAPATGRSRSHHLLQASE